MLARTYFPLLTVLISCTAKTGHPDVEPTGSRAPSSLVEPGAGADAAQPPHVALEADDPSLTAEQRAVALVSRMTLAEKAEQLGHAAPAIPRLRVPQYNWWNEGLH